MRRITIDIITSDPDNTVLIYELFEVMRWLDNGSKSGDINTPSLIISMRTKYDNIDNHFILTPCIKCGQYTRYDSPDILPICFKCYFVRIN